MFHVIGVEDMCCVMGIKGLCFHCHGCQGFAISMSQVFGLVLSGHGCQSGLHQCGGCQWFMSHVTGVNISYINPMAVKGQCKWHGCQGVQGAGGMRNSFLREELRNVFPSCGVRLLCGQSSFHAKTQTSCIFGICMGTSHVGGLLGGINKCVA